MPACPAPVRLVAVAAAVVATGCAGAPAAPGPPPPACDDPGLAGPDVAVLAPERGEAQIVGGSAELHAEARYPGAARQFGLEGQVVVAFVVDAGGRLVCRSVVDSTDPVFEESALRAVSAMTFRPYRPEGAGPAVPFGSQATVRFRLR